MSKKKEKLTQLHQEIEQIILAATQYEEQYKDAIDKVHPKYLASAKNLLHYRAMRTLDISSIQKQLGTLGLSRLAKAESHLMASLRTNSAILKSLIRQKPLKLKRHSLSPKKGAKLIRSNAKNLLGYRSKGRRTRIMVTLPSEAADNYDLIHQMIKAGMNCARINCAHDNEAVWAKMIQHVRTASKRLGKKCKVAMDLGGPKIRTGQLETGPQVRKFRPAKDRKGQILSPLSIWMGPDPHPSLPHLPIAPEELAKLKEGQILFVRDARGKKRPFEVVERQEHGFTGNCFKTTFVETGMTIFADKALEQAIATVGALPAVEQSIVLQNGDLLLLLKTTTLGSPHQVDETGTIIQPAQIYCSNEAVFDYVEVGETILFDDGKIEGKVQAIVPEGLHLNIRRVPQGGGKLKADKGINFPDSALQISGLTEKDKQDLPFVVAHADVVNFSFVNRPEDVQELYTLLEELSAPPTLGIVLKIETQRGFNQLTEILLTAMQRYPVGVMIARGDLAIEVGWDNIARVQEEISSLCHAAHLTDIWATQVLENLAKSGLPSRAEITDAARAQRADCVMLNKGPYIVNVIQLLSTILKDLDPYQYKNAPLHPAMTTASPHSPRNSNK
ncbi:MAG: pyruvate kinase [Bacteroidota bacterium]